MGLPGQQVQYTKSWGGRGGHGEGTHPFPWKWIFMALFHRGYDRVDWRRGTFFLFYFFLFKLPALSAGLGNGVAVHADCRLQHALETGDHAEHMNKR